MLLLHPLLLAIAMVVVVVVCRYFTYTDTSSTCCNQSYVIIWIKNNTFGNNHSYSSFAVVVTAAVAMKIHKDSQNCS